MWPPGLQPLIQSHFLHLFTKMVKRNDDNQETEWVNSGWVWCFIFLNIPTLAGQEWLCCSSSSIAANSLEFITKNISCREETVVERCFLPDWSCSSSTEWERAAFPTGRVCGQDNYKNLLRIIPYFLSKQGVIYLHLKKCTSETGRVNHTGKGLVPPHATGKKIQSLAQMFIPGF